MIGRQIAIIFGIAALLPLLIFYGVSTFSPAPKFEDYSAVAPYNPTATAEERAAIAEKQKAGQAAFREAQKQFASRLFYVSAPIGYAALIAGGVMAVSALGTGLMFGGLFTLGNGFWQYWIYIPDWERFLCLLGASAILAMIALRKVAAPGRSEMRRP